MGERYPNDSQLETMFADYQRLKEENAALRRLLVENGITIPAQPRSSPPPPAKGMCTMLESMSTQAKTQRSPCSVVCSVDGKMCMPFECDSRAVSGVMFRPRFATGKQFFLRKWPFERRSIRRPGSCYL